MKIARNLPVSERHVEWYAPLPAPSLRELLSAAKLRECTSMLVPGKKFRVYMNWCVYWWLGATNGGHSLSLAFARQLPQRGSREWAAPFIQPPGNRNVAGDFHRPYESSEVGRFYHSTKYTPSVSFADSSLREGAGKRPHSTGCSLNRGVGGRFSSPLRNCEFSTPYEYGVHSHRGESGNGV